MTDHGEILISTKELIDNAEFNTSLETTDIIEPEQEIVLIKANKSTHLFLINEFVKSNISKRNYINPYNRNIISFSDTDLSKLNKLKREIIKSMKNIPHEIFEKMINVMKVIKEKDLQLIYFNEITNIFNILLSAIPFFESIEEIENINNIITDIENNLISSLDVFLENLNNDASVQENKKVIDYLTIPDQIKETYNFMFSELVTILEQISELNIEFENKDAILDIFKSMDHIYIYLTNHSINSEEQEIKVVCLLCVIEEKINELKSLI
jgi:hypothetical protein